MFDQATFDSGSRRLANPWTMSASVALQAMVLSAAVLVPMLHIEPMPPVHLVERRLPPPHIMTVAIPASLQQIIQTTVARIPSPFHRKVFNLPTARPAQPHGPIVDPDFTGPLLANGGPPPLDLSTMPNLNNPPITLSQPKQEPPVARPQPAVAVQKTYRIGGDVKGPVLKSAPRPGYPPLARAARIQGTVRLNGIVSRDGTVRSLELASGHPLLVQAALNAVRTWLYDPARLNGQPVDVILVIDVNFTLTQ